jgi:hypothetical protein
MTIMAAVTISVILVPVRFSYRLRPRPLSGNRAALRRPAFFFAVQDARP